VKVINILLILLMEANMMLQHPIYSFSPRHLPRYFVL
jgi:hypothetical protein